MSKSNDEIHDTDLQAPTHLLKRSPYLVIKALINERMITLVQNNAACRSNSCIYIWFVTGVFFSFYRLKNIR